MRQDRAAKREGFSGRDRLLNAGAEREFLPEAIKRFKPRHHSAVLHLDLRRLERPAAFYPLATIEKVKT
jgi:hypothetical protein